MKRIRILIADDHALVLEGFRKLLEVSHDVVAAVTDGHALLAAADTVAADIALVDINMPKLNGLDAIERLKSRQPRLRVIVFTMNEDPETAAEAIRRGASGYLLKSSPPAELKTAIEEVARGALYLSPAIAEVPSAVFAAEARRGPIDLSLRQREVLQLLAEGRSMKEAAGILGVTPRTIAFHKYALMDRLRLETSADLIRYAISSGLISKGRTDS